jgi:hypothetical protein
MYAFAPEKTPSLAGRNFCLAILQIFGRQPFYPMRGASLHLFFQFLFPLSGEILSKRNRSSIFSCRQNDQCGERLQLLGRATVLKAGFMSNISTYAVFS